jgi:exodeoxyribonuclease-3
MASTAFPLRPAAAIPEKLETISESTTIPRVVEDVKIIVWNVNGVRARLKKDQFLEVIRNQNADMWCLQEVRCGLEQLLRKKDVRKTLEELGYKYIVHQTSKHNVGYAGVAIISKIPCLSHGQGVSNVKLDTEGRVVWTEYEKFVLVNAYAPNSGNELELVTLPKRLEWETELSKLLTKLKETKKKEIFYTGDLNVVHQDDGVWGGITNPRWKQFPSCSLEERTTFQKLVDKHKFLSLKQDRNVPGYTFFSRPWDRIKNRGMILDYSLCTKPFADAYVKNYRLRPEIRGSDHVPQEVVFRASLFPEKTRQKKDPISLSTTEAEAISSIEGWSDFDTSEYLQALSSSIEEFQNPDHMAEFISDRDQEIHDWIEPDLETKGGTGDAAPPELNVITALGEALPSIRKKLDPEGTGHIALADLEKFVQSFNESHIEDAECISSREWENENISSLKPQGTPILPLVHAHVGNNALEALVDSGATSSIADAGALKKIMGIQEYSQRLKRNIFRPYFRTAAGKVCQPVGRIEIAFELGGVPFEWPFWVLDTCAHDLILGNDFSAEHGANLDYTSGHIEFSSSLAGGERVHLPFNTYRPSPTERLQVSVAILATEDTVLQPFTARVVDGFTPEVPDGMTDTFGFCVARDTARKISIPHSCASLVEGKTRLLIANLEKGKRKYIRKGQPLATFVTADITDFDMYACNLDAFGTDDFYLDLNKKPCVDNGSQRQVRDPSIGKGNLNSEPSLNTSVHCKEIDLSRGKICAKKFEKGGKCECERSYSNSDNKQQDQSESARRESENSYSNSNDEQQNNGESASEPFLEPFGQSTNFSVDEEIDHGSTIGRATLKIPTCTASIEMNGIHVSTVITQVSDGEKNW